jgi:protein-disulfide isomerase
LPGRSTRRSPIAFVSLAALVVGAVAIVILGSSASRGATREARALQRPAGPSAPAPILDGLALGQPVAPVTLRVFSDFQCPVCGTFGLDYLPRLVADFVVPGDLRVVDEPIAILGADSADDESLASAVAATCAAGDNRYWAYHDWLFANQQGENAGAFSARRLAGIADAVIENRAEWDACVADPAVAASIQARTRAAAGAGIVSTPTFLLGDQVFVGLPRDYATLADRIEAVLAAAPAS